MAHEVDPQRRQKEGACPLPSSASKTLSTSNCRPTCQRLAPSAARSAISF